MVVFYTLCICGPSATWDAVPRGIGRMASLRILHLEDNELDGEFIRMSLEQADIVSDITRVETRDGFLTQLHQQHFDLIVSDFSLPSFDGLSALKLVREKKLDTPFIFVSGTIGEERAVAALRD